MKRETADKSLLWYNERGGFWEEIALEPLAARQDVKPFDWEEWSKRPPIDFGEEYPGEFEDWLRDLRQGYREMAADKAHEAEALEWAEATIEDIADEPWEQGLGEFACRAHLKGWRIMGFIDVSTDSTIVLPCGCIAHTTWDRVDRAAIDRAVSEGGVPVFVTQRAETCDKHLNGRPNSMERNETWVSVISER